MPLSVLCAGRAMESGIEAAAVGIRTVGGLTEGMDFRPSLAIDDGEPWGNSRLLSRFNSAVSAIARYSVCGVLSRDMWCGLVQFGNHGMPIRPRFR